MLSLVEGLQIIQVNGVHMLLGSSKNFFVGSNIYLLPSAVKFCKLLTNVIMLSLTFTLVNVFFS